MRPTREARDPEMCSASVPTRGMNFARDHRCPNRSKVRVGDKGYCGIHDPARVAEKRRERNEEWKRKDAVQTRKWAREGKAREILTVAQEWRRLHFTGAVCGECEHLECALARKVDEYDAI